MAAAGRVPVSVWWYAPNQDAARANASDLNDADTRMRGGAQSAGGADGGPKGSGRRLGPMAQDVAAAFGVGSDARRIDSIDADGSLLAALQGCALTQQDLSAQRSFVFLAPFLSLLPLSSSLRSARSSLSPLAPFSSFLSLAPRPTPNHTPP